MLDDFVMNGHDSSVLALIAQCHKSLRHGEDFITPDGYAELTKKLRPEVLEIADEIAGYKKSRKKDVKAAARGFIDWANSLGSLGIRKEYECPRIKDEWYFG